MVKKEEIPKAFKNPKNALKVASVRLDNLAGKIFFKNTAGLKCNLDGKKTLSSIKNKKNFDTINPVVEEIKEKGFVNLGHPFDGSLIEKILEKYNKMIEDDRISFVLSKHDGHVYSRMLNRAFKKIPEVKNLITKELSDMISNYYGANFKVFHVQMWRNYYVPNDITMKKEMFGNNWHCDGANSSITTMFINLSNVNDENGPLYVQNIKRTKELLKLGYKSRYDYNVPIEVLEDPKNIVKHTGSSGSTIWANTQYIFHRAGIPEKGHYRDLMQLRFLPSNIPLQEDWPDYCEGSNAEIIYNKQGHFDGIYH